MDGGVKESVGGIKSKNGISIVSLLFLDVVAQPKTYWSGIAPKPRLDTPLPPSYFVVVISDRSIDTIS